MEEQLSLQSKRAMRYPVAIPRVSLWVPHIPDLELPFICDFKNTKLDTFTDQPRRPTGARSWSEQFRTGTGNCIPVESDIARRMVQIVRVLTQVMLLSQPIPIRCERNLFYALEQRANTAGGRNNSKSQ